MSKIHYDDNLPLLLWLPLTSAQLASIRRGNSLRLEVRGAEDDDKPATIVMIRKTRKTKRLVRRRIGRYVRRGYQT